MLLLINLSISELCLLKSNNIYMNNFFLRGLYFVATTQLLISNYVYLNKYSLKQTSKIFYLLGHWSHLEDPKK